MDEVTVSGKTYISSKRAAELSGYAQDYIGQLARTRQIDAQRVGNLWYVSLESLQAYKDHAETYKPQAPAYQAPSEPSAIVTLEGKEYVSASRAAKLTGYNQDYVGQLARSGQITARQVGNRWYIDKDALLSHKSAKDKLLAAVQVESVGLAHMTERMPQPRPALAMLTYSADTRDLIPAIEAKEVREAREVKEVQEAREVQEAQEVQATSIPIRVLHVPKKKEERVAAIVSPYQPFVIPAKTKIQATHMVAALTVVIVISVGIASLNDHATYATSGVASSSLAAATGEAITQMGDVITDLLGRELVYRRE